MRTASLLAIAALLIALLAAGVLTFADTSSSTSCEATPGGVQTCTDASSTLIQENGSWVLALLAVPVLLAAAAVGAIVYQLPTQIEWILALAAFAGCIVAIFSVGIFFLPTALLLVVAAAKDHRSTFAS
jgi:hypothetical protein